MRVSLPTYGLAGTKKKFKPHGKYRPLAIKYTGETKTDKSIKCTISSEEIPFHLLRPDGKDVVFLDENGNILPYWIEAKNSTLMQVWLKFPKASKSFLPVYMYHNNLQDVKLSDISAAFSYRRKITIAEQSGSDLTDYPILFSLDETNFDFTRFQNKGQDLRFTDSSGNILPYYADISPWKARIYVKVPHIPANGQTEIYMYYGNPEISSASSGQDTFLFYEDFTGSFKPCTFNTPKFYEMYKITIDSQAHSDYGLVYPITYVFEVEAGATKAQKSKDGSTWEDISQPTSDWYNFEEVVRFEDNRAYLSVKFYDDADELYLRFVDDSGNVKQARLLEIAKYYDNRRWVAIFTADDAYMGWVGNDTDKFCDELQSREMWGTIGVVTTDTNWSKIQTQIDEGFIEVASHSRTHPKTPYSDYEAEIDQSKQEILSNLNLPSHQKRGSKEYVWSWVAPYGTIDDEVRTQCGQSKYLCMRQANPSAKKFAVKTVSFYVPWDNDNNVYEEILATEDLHDGDVSSYLESIIDFAYEKGLVAIFYGHRIFDIFGDLLDYAKNKGDLWSVSLGHFFNYWYVAERGKITVEGYDGIWHTISYTPAHVENMPSCSPISMECKDDPGPSVVRITDDNKLFIGGPYTFQYRSRAVGEIDLTDKISLITKFRVVQKEDHGSEEGVVAVSIDDNTLETSLDGDCPATFYIDEVNNKFSYLSNSSVNEIANLDRQTDHILEIAADQSKYIYIKLDDEIVEDKPLNFAPTDGWRYLHLWSKTGRWVSVLFDYVIARPITDPEPQVSIGSEESEAAVNYFVVNDTKFLYRRKITITEESGSDLNEYQVCINLNSSNFDFFHAQPDGRDIRFFDSSNDSLYYWIEEWDTSNERAKIWVRIPSLAANSTKEIFMYYGNSELSDGGNAEEVFDFFDDFDYPAGDLDGVGGWQDCGDINAHCNGDGTVTITSSSSYVKIVNSKEIDLIDWIIEYKGRFPGVGSYNDVGVVWKSDYLTSGSADLAFYYRRAANKCELLRHTNMPGDNGAEKHYIEAGVLLDDDFHVFKIIYTSSNKQATAFVDDTQINQYTFSAEPSGKCVGLFIHEYYDTEFTFDWIRVRKYASKEPSVSVGAEETA